ncbi:hypothetical protein M899_0577 [Bacteriovorax sp. BSW11_IV]|uniref:hypothetical protein n=1 Tax=Bacteriovorax sp. BSW11_IV TaxID=1353529 RepID=UPI00038A2ECA|nr:hypothetical protein [Bacteriovorax sp. BSW11_IV]EQC45071.1 hypothetical protein M899_0577 [Bacteriovorax sp. BSW11_IV]
MHSPNYKKVYVLGAGFSIEAGAPNQYDLIKNIFELNDSSPNLFDREVFERFKKFLSEDLFISEEHFGEVELEDIFTPLDRCIAENTSFRGLSFDEMKRARSDVYYLIAKMLDEKLRDIDSSYIDKFAKHLVFESKKRSNNRYKMIDPVSVVSMNWDIMLDNYIKKNIDLDESTIKGVVDYCCHVSSFNKYDNTIKPGLEILGAGGYNVKLLKIHGSLNWLACPRCYRNYVGFNEKIGLYQFMNQQECRHCKENFKKDRKSSHLNSSLVMPTFIKDLDSPQYKQIWQNSAVELSEASEVIFIGYSLPSADFEFRQLLSRMVRKNAKITVVDFSSESDKQNIPVFKRYKRFFGKREIIFHWNGTKSYVEKYIED